MWDTDKILCICPVDMSNNMFFFWGLIVLHGFVFQTMCMFWEYVWISCSKETIDMSISSSNSGGNTALVWHTACKLLFAPLCFSSLRLWCLLGLKIANDMLVCKGNVVVIISVIMAHCRLHQNHHLKNQSLVINSPWVIGNDVSFYCISYIFPHSSF